MLMVPNKPFEAVFISDLHLHPEEPMIMARFNHFIDWAAINTQSVYILGDFFTPGRVMMEGILGVRLSLIGLDGYLSRKFPFISCTGIVIFYWVLDLLNPQA